MTDQNQLYIDAIYKRPVRRTPIWIMRQAGRYLPEYRSVREKYDFITVCKTPELAMEVTLQPIRRFEFDAAILFSDILVIPEAMGQQLEFMEDHGPKLSPQILEDKDFEILSTESLEQKLEYVGEAVKLISAELSGTVPLIGFSGSPFTLATYMVEGKPTRNFKHIKTLLYSEPDRLTRLLNMLTEAVIRYLTMQVNAGAQALQIFDTWGGILPVHLFSQFSASYMRKIVAALKPLGVPITLFSKGGIEFIKVLADSGADVLGVDWMTDIAEAKALAGKVAALQGNLDPTVLYGGGGVIQREVSNILQVFKGESGHVFNLGHGILPDVPVENVQFLVDEVRSQSERLHSSSDIT
ncbi:MAG: uroporphyrinogen decarboxylase [Candidatus Latescibacteria bacterium]|nr:uroporphyrinogen decarboxylase [Candidatus Latescibacterota bacterium]NIO27180.1 uroporphyrinogen decarboxylase [Candidatus Latescibacterota bacterium]NIO54704.1 uroporphyrinogen decarboxylase [Candidatus Latescibacterota bacterium]NIT00787.1 uroporphyrinogen decarboxylase [Candidatus Latescibacterota bacterium]NIT37710.1 uroporphyrinogen decarboxylase [Candidatus Latescibacterota bacterium]